MLEIPVMDPIWNHPAVAAGKIILELGEASTNIWVLDPVS